MSDVVDVSQNELFELVSLDKEMIKSQIFEVRGYRVILDKDIATYFGIETKALNRAMKRNIKRFPENFCFQLSSDECSRYQIGTLNNGRGSNIKYLPYVYTETGVAMLTSTLHSDRAIAASIQIMEAFVEMSHFIRQNKQLLPYDYLKEIEFNHYKLSDRVQSIEEKMVTSDELSDFMKLFNSDIKSEEILILNGEPFKADIAFQKIYKKAKKRVIIIDDYLGVKSLHHLTYVKQGVSISIISDNKGYSPLRASDIEDFQTEYPQIVIGFIKSLNKVHDRFIVLDYGMKSMKVYLCGSSSKDSGKKITVITELNETTAYKEIIEELLSNPPLKLS